MGDPISSRMDAKFDCAVKRVEYAVVAVITAASACAGVVAEFALETAFTIVFKASSAFLL